MANIWSPGVTTYNPQNASGGGISLGVPTASGANVAPGTGINVGGAVNPMNYTDPTASGTDPGAGSGSGTGTGSGSGTSSTLSQDIINAILTSIANSVAQNQQDYTHAQEANASNDTTQGNIYDTQVHGNSTNRELAVHNAETAAAQGRQGLRSVLASLGALGGTGTELAGRAVANTANEDIGGADKTYQDNANSIAQAHEAYQSDAKNRDDALTSALDADNKDANSKGIQSILNAAQSVGDTSTYNQFLPQLVASTAPTAPIRANTLTYNPASVGSFAPPSNLQVSTKPTTTSATTPVNSALYVSKKAQG